MFNSLRHHLSANEFQWDSCHPWVEICRAQVGPKFRYPCYYKKEV
ncbi:hypothetical protein SLEP1_g12330 [Rubroshorea leprosula]|uniref:Uncharacterized protein n=1 Tax=Rubroshorea leprosula TaxID=152421 RepID=A0AAV5IC54_9ROSI|nr:hypothetical protein SLEP1_g12330 [Rubroshorea leprosula]